MINYSVQETALRYGFNLTEWFPSVITNGNTPTGSTITLIIQLDPLQFKNIDINSLMFIASYKAKLKRLIFPSEKNGEVKYEGNKLVICVPKLQIYEIFLHLLHEALDVQP